MCVFFGVSAHDGASMTEPRSALSRVGIADVEKVLPRARAYEGIRTSYDGAHVGGDDGGRGHVAGLRARGHIPRRRFLVAGGGSDDGRGGEPRPATVRRQYCRGATEE